jgi:hypothetical protein
MFLAAEVMHSHAAYLYGEVGYVMGCKLLERMERAPQSWHDLVRKSTQDASALCSEETEGLACARSE